MSVTTFTELKTAIADFLNREDLTATIPTFISLAEADLNRRVRHWRMLTRSASTVSARYVEIPTDWLETVWLTVDDRTLRPIGHADLLDRYEAADGVGGKPQYYAMTGEGFELSPVPDDTYDADLLYYAKLPALSDSVADNWLLTYAPDAYLYGALVHSAPYLKDDPRLQVWAALSKSAVDSLNAESMKARHSGTGLRMRIG